VNQGGETRAFRYDSEGHLLFERIPEMPALVNDGTGTMWSCKYTHTSFGAIATKIDGRGVVITYGYDTLNRLTSISYNTSGASGVASTPNVAYNYDTNQSSSTNGLLLSLSAGSGYSESYNYDGFNRVQSVTRTIDGRNYTTSYQQNTANQLTQTTYPSGRVISLSRDSIGRLTSVGSYLTNVTYSGIGQRTGTSLGNGVTESYGYDANRMQLTSQVATKSGGPTGGLMNLTYNYQASAGQTGSGSTAGNAGQLMSISGTTGGSTESAAYTYDDLGRLVTSNQTSNGSSAQRRFAFDRWGNRTGMWDATSGGNQLQNIVIDGGNHIWSVNASNSNPNYYYDPAGNLVWAEGHSYTYDAENRLVSVDGGATGQYSYDPSNRRYKKVTGGVTTDYIWQGSQVIAEHEGSTGVVTAEYVYSGNRIIAKLSSGVTQYFLGDRLSVRLMLDASGNVIGGLGHLPFGEDFAGSGLQEKHHFTSYERDAESSTDYAVNRQYAQSAGRFMRADPLRKSCDNGNPQNWNKYSYTANNPVNRVDPSGLDSLASSINELNWYANLAWWLHGPGSSGKHDPLLDTGLEPTDETGGGLDFSIKVVYSTYQYVRDVPIGCLYKLFCVFNSRATCGDSFHVIVTRDRRTCPRYVRASSLYVHVKANVDECVDVGITVETPRAEPCT
jgi:RHS repeat-associated protein